MSANGEGAKKMSISEIPRRVDSQLHSFSSTPQPQPIASPPDHDRARIDIAPEEVLGSSDRLSSSTDNIIYVSDDTASDRADASSHEPCTASPSSVQTAVQSLECTGSTGNISKWPKCLHATVKSTFIASFLALDYHKTSKYDDKREATPRSISLMADETQANQSARLFSIGLAGCSTVIFLWTSRDTTSMATPGPAILQVVSPLPGDRSEDPASTLTSREHSVEIETE